MHFNRIPERRKAVYAVVVVGLGICLVPHVVVAMLALTGAAAVVVGFSLLLMAG